jgi:hypothetical protein
VRRNGSGLHWRVALWVGLIGGWLVMLLYLWSAFATFPSAERLEHTRMVRIPTLRSIALLAGRSAIELAGLLALLWPWHGRRFTLRLFAAATLLAGWFLATTPLSLSAAGWVHRRWLAAMALGLVIALAAAVAASLVRRWTMRRVPRT